MINIQKNKESGFTVLELLIAMSVFALILIAVTGIFIRATYLQRRAFAIEQIQSTVLAATESIARDAKVSDICAAGSICHIFRVEMDHPDRGNVVYEHDVLRGVLVRTEGGISADFTSTDVEFTRFDFIVTGEGPISDCRQPRVTMVMSARNRNGRPQIDIDMQTTVTSRDVRQEFLDPAALCP